MTWTAGEAIEEAREIHPAFSPENVPDSVLLRFLDRYHQELYDRIVHIDPHFAAESWEIEFPIDQEHFNRGLPLPKDWDTPLGGKVLFTESKRTRRLNFIPWGNRHEPGCRYPATIIGGTLFFIGIHTDWDLVDTVTVYYVPEVKELSSTSDLADLPDRAKGVCVERIALQAAARVQGMESEPVDVGFTMEDFRETEEIFLRRVARPAKAETAYIRDVW